MWGGCELERRDRLGLGLRLRRRLYIGNDVMGLGILGNGCRFSMSNGFG